MCRSRAQLIAALITLVSSLVTLGDATTAPQRGGGSARRTNGKTVYINEESTEFSSVLADLNVRQLIAQPNYSFPCGSAEWGVHNALVSCSVFGGEANAIEVADAGGWTHAYQQFAVDQGDVYRVSGEFYPLAIGECDGSAAVKWCSPSVVVCPGPHNGDYYNTGGCYGGVASVGNYSWEPFSFFFSSTTGLATVYINQESTEFSSVVNGLRIKLLHERFADAYTVGTTIRIGVGFGLGSPGPCRGRSMLIRV